MSRNQSDHVIIGGLALLTLLSLAFSLQAIVLGTISERIVELVLYASLTAFALILSVPLLRSELSIAHAIGMIALLSLPADIIPVMSVALFMGGLVGAVGRRQLRRRGQVDERQSDLFTIVHITARVTLPYFVAGHLYYDLLDGSLPIDVNSDISQNLISVSAFALVYVALYFASFTLQRKSVV